MANSAASTLLNYARGILRVDGSSTSNPALQDTIFLAQLNHANAEWQRTFRRSGGAPPTFLERETGIDLIASTTLTAAQTTASTTAVLTSASSFASSGAIAVYDDGMPDIEEYTSNAVLTLSGVTGVNWAHESGDQVSSLYVLPSNFGSFRAQEGFGDGMKIGNTPYTFTSGVPEGARFSIYDNGTTKYLWTPLGLTGSVLIAYNKVSNTIDETTDTVDVPVEYEWFLVYRLVEFGLRSRGDDANLIAEAKQMGNTILRESQVEKNITKIAHTRPISRNRSMSEDDYFKLTTRDS